MKRAACILASVSVLLALAGLVQAQQNVGVVSNVKVISDKVEDVTTLDDWKKSYIKDGMSDQDKCVAIWKTVIRYRHQDAPPNEYLDGVGGTNVHDPMKTIHVYGYGMCCCASSNVEGLARFLGYPARGRVIVAHSVPEVSYGGAWHLFDGSVMNYQIKEDGTAAGVDEIRDAVRNWYKDNPDLSKKLRGNDGALRAFAKDEGWKKGPALLARCPYYRKDGTNDAGWHGWMSNMQEYDISLDKCYVDDYGPQMGYGVNVQLREGEKLTRNWSNKGLHVNQPGGGPGIMTDDQWKGVNGLQKKFGDVAPGRVGNGVLEWNVPLGKLAVAALWVENLAPNAAKQADPAKPGVFVLRMPTSYIYLTGKLDLKANIGNDGSVAVSFSDNNGLDWKDVTKVEKSGDASFDLTKFAFRRYDYRLKFELKGGASLTSVKIAHDVQHSQAPLPAILPGKNTITFSAGAQEGTITLEGNLDEASKDKQLSIMDFHPALDSIAPKYFSLTAGRGSATFTVDTPGDMTRLRVNAYWRARDAKDGWVEEASFDDGKTWVKMADLTGPIKGDSKYVVFDQVPAKTRKALVRFTGSQRNTTCLFSIAIRADYKEPFGGFKPVKITYAWTENGKEKTNEHVAQQPKDTWTITCADGSVPKSYTVELAK